MADFDYHRFLTDKWGDPERLLRYLHSYGYKDAKLPAVTAWFRRRSIPSEWFAVLTTLLEIEHGAPVSTAEYLK